MSLQLFQSVYRLGDLAEHFTKANGVLQLFAVQFSVVLLDLLLQLRRILLNYHNSLLLLGHFALKVGLRISE
jgi:hypothetical protein